jgi:hypothetical protein
VNASDWAEIARRECQDGCARALQRCQPGYFCTAGAMLPCPTGTFRNATNLPATLVQSCIQCPVGTYREEIAGLSIDSCTACRTGTFQNVTGASSEAACKRCPDGYWSSSPGSEWCTCINAQSCIVSMQDREKDTEPYTGRW